MLDPTSAKTRSRTCEDPVLCLQTSGEVSITPATIKATADDNLASQTSRQLGGAGQKGTPLEEARGSSELVHKQVIS